MNTFYLQAINAQSMCTLLGAALTVWPVSDVRGANSRMACFAKAAKLNALNGGNKQ